MNSIQHRSLRLQWRGKEEKDKPMRNNLDILRDIESALSRLSLYQELADLKEEVLASSTGGELCARVGSWLLTNEQIQPLSNLRIEFISYCHANGLYPHKQTR